MLKVLIPTKLNPVALDILKRNQFTVLVDDKTELKELVKQHADAVALIVRSEKITAEIIDALPSLKLIVRAGAGYDTIDIKHARRKGVDVMNTPGANANGVAEEVIALALAAFRHIIKADATTRAGLWEKKSLSGRELAGKTIGIVGLGHIGQLVVKRLAGFEVEYLGFDPLLSAPRAKELGVELTTLDDLFSRSDIVTLHAPETDETRGMVNRRLLELMKPGSVLINCARSGLINEDDLRAVKPARKLVFCNDVYLKDAAGPKSVTDIADIMMPHLGASTEEAETTAARRAADQLVSYIERGVTTYVVNRGVPEGLDAEYQVLAYYLTRTARAFLGSHDQPEGIEASFYGGLDAFSSFLLGPIALGLSGDFDPFFNQQEAESFLAGKGISYQKRATDPQKRYGKSITIDLVQGNGSTSKRVSVRGTITEGRPMVARINGYEGLYFDPVGHSVLVEYQDQPGMLAKISAVIAKHGINIEDVRAPQDRKGGKSLAVLKVNQCVSAAVVEELATAVSAVKAVSLHVK